MKTVVTKDKYGNRQVISKRGVIYQESTCYDLSWRIMNKWDGTNRFVGAIHNLPKEIKKAINYKG